MTSSERRAALALASIFATRMLGLFMILPVFSLYAHELDGVTPTLIGLAIGIYGLTQALLQLPYGLLSDRFGRKPLIALGLTIFVAGSVVAAMADSIYGVIAGRALQGAGAIAAVVMALAADLTREEHRTKAMAIIGMTIGASFALAMVAGPILNSWIGVPGIFWLTAGLGVLGLVILRYRVPQPVHSRVHRDAELIPAQLSKVLRNGELVRLDVGIFILHLILTASFVVLPFALRDVAGLDSQRHWQVYLPVLLMSAALMVPFIIVAERRRRMKQVFVGAIMTLALAELGLLELHAALPGLIVALVVYFTAFNLLEASLPSLIAKTAPPDKKGTAMGVYSSAQFLGAFVGGTAGGWLYGHWGIEGVFVGCAVLAGLWGLLAATMQNPRYLSSYVLNVGPVDERQASQLVGQLTGITGVAEAVVIVEDGIAYLKVDQHALDREALHRYAVAD